MHGNYDIPVILTIDSDSYDKALKDAKQIVNGMREMGLKIEVDTSYEYDNDGQRVVYLHPEDEPT